MKLLLFFSPMLAVIAQATEVRTERVPEAGVQPQIVQDATGILHLVYLKGEPGRSDVRYATRKPSEPSWSKPITVNSEPGTAVAAGTIRGAQLALGQDRSIHVVWNGPGRKDMPSALFYARLEVGKSTFEPQRNLRGDTKGLDGGASIAADTKGQVFVVWHGAPAGASPGEANRAVFVLKSADNGSTFASVKIANADDMGVCACCSLKSFITPAGELHMLYRAARSMNQRDVTLLASRDGGTSFTHRIVGTWAIAACPMSSMTMIAIGAQTRAAWESEGKVFTSLLEDSSAAVAISGDKARHPALAINSRGETLISWSVGTGWQKGGQLAWAVLDARGKQVGSLGTAPGVPVWGMTAAYDEGDRFVIMY